MSPTIPRIDVNEPNQFTTSNNSNMKARIIYDDRQTKMIPNEKLSFLLGFISCHKNGTANNNIG